MSPHNKSSFKARFAGLPAELRIMIYKEIFCSGTSSVDIESRQVSLTDGFASALEGSGPGSSVRFLRTSRQLYHESLPFLYNRCDFKFSTASAAHHFLVQIGQCARDLLRSITLPIPPSSFYVGELPLWRRLVFSELQKCRNLRSLNLVVDYSTYFDVSGHHEKAFNHPASILRGLNEVVFTPVASPAVHWATPKTLGSGWRQDAGIKHVADKFEDDLRSVITQTEFGGQEGRLVEEDL